MTRADIFIQILSEVTGRPKAELASLLAMFRSVYPGGRWDDVLPDNEAQALLEGLRKEKEGIRAWLAKGAQQFIRCNHPGQA